MKKSIIWTLVIGLLIGGILTWAVNPKAAAVIRQPLVAPGEYDKYYGFLSGGPAGDVRVVGIPSMRLLRRIPVFEASAQYNYGMENDSVDLGENSWADSHHPVLSEKAGDYDGRWLFIHDKPNSRVARIDLSTWKTDKITELPNVQGVHGTAVHPDTKYLTASGEYLIPIPNDARAPLEEYKSAVSFVDPETMKVEFQVLAPQTDNLDWGKGGKQLFGTVYNMEGAMTIEGMIRDDQDAVAVFNLPIIEKAYAEGNYTEINGVPVIDPQKIGNGVEVIPHGQGKQRDAAPMYLIEVPKNPHGVDVTPDGKYAIANGKLSPTVSIIDTKTLQVLVEPNVGLGPLHTTYDGRGNGYTSNFIDSQVVKWDIDKAVAGDPDFIIDRIDVHYNPGHVQAVEAETVNPAGDWLLSLNKLSKDRYVDVGPDMPENDELINISGQKMRMVMEAPMDLEPHDAVFISADKLLQTNR